MGLIVVASIFLVVVLIIASLLDYKYQTVPNFLWLIVGATCLLLLIQSQINADTYSKSMFLILTAVYGSLTYALGQWYFDKGYYGGADIKFAMVVSILLSSMGVTGSLFYIWFLVIHPLMIFINIKVTQNTRIENILQVKLAFIPFMTFMFLGVCLIHILMVN
jgi:hypothetical protein